MPDVASVKLRPLTGWPADRKPEPFRRQAQFSASWSDTKALLASEGGHLGARLVVVEFDVVGGEAAFRIDGSLRANARPGLFPGVRVSMETRHGPLAYLSDRYQYAYSGQPPSWQANARAVALSLQALRAVDRHGVTSRGEQYIGWRALPAADPDDLPTRRAAAARLLIRLGDVTGTLEAGDVLADPGLMRRLFARAARAHHPDAGGDRNVFEQIVAARDLLGAGQ